MDAGDARRRVPRRDAPDRPVRQARHAGGLGDPSAPEAIFHGCACGQIEYFLAKPWHGSPDEQFHHEIADLLYLHEYLAARRLERAVV